MFFKIGAVFLPLELKQGPLPGACPLYRARDGLPLGEVEAAVPVVSGAQFLLCLGQLSRGEQTGPEASLYIVPQHPLSGLGLPEGAQPLFPQQAASLALALSRAAEPPQGVSPVPAGLQAAKKLRSTRLLPSWSNVLRWGRRYHRYSRSSTPWRT